MVAAINTLLAGAAGGVSTMLYTWLFTPTKKPSPAMSVNGILAGLVAITAPCAFVDPWGAVIIGLVAGVLVVLATGLLEKAKIDDPVGAVPVHFVNGMWGVLAVGIFAVGNPDTAAWNGVESPVTGIVGGSFARSCRRYRGRRDWRLGIWPIVCLLYGAQARRLAAQPRRGRNQRSRPARDGRAGLCDRRHPGAGRPGERAAAGAEQRSDARRLSEQSCQVRERQSASPVLALCSPRLSIRMHPVRPLGRLVLKGACDYVSTRQNDLATARRLEQLTLRAVADMIGVQPARDLQMR